MDPITIGAIVVGGGCIAYSAVHRNRAKKKALANKNRQEEALRNALVGVKVGAWVREPNGSANIIQNLIEQELASRGAAVFALRNDHARTLLEEGNWNTEIASSRLDVALVGKIIIRTDANAQVYEYPTMLNIHTATGRRFDQLPFDHPDYRKPNSEFAMYDSYEYHEPREEYERRRELEKVVVTRSIVYCTLDIRFYGPSGEIRGGCAEQVNDLDYENPTRTLVDRLISNLAKAVKPSIEAHERSSSLAESAIIR